MAACASLKSAGRVVGSVPGRHMTEKWSQKVTHLLQNSHGCGALARFLNCSGFGIELAGPDCSFSSHGGDFRFLGFMSGQETGVYPRGILWFEVTSRSSWQRARILFGPVFRVNQHRPTPRPAVERIHRKALLPFGSYSPHGGVRPLKCWSLIDTY